MKNLENTIELRPKVYETMSKRNVEANGENAGFFHSLGRATGPDYTLLNWLTNLSSRTNFIRLCMIYINQ